MLPQVPGPIHWGMGQALGTPVSIGGVVEPDSELARNAAALAESIDSIFVVPELMEMNLCDGHRSVSGRSATRMQVARDPLLRLADKRDLQVRRAVLFLVESAAVDAGSESTKKGFFYKTKDRQKGDRCTAMASTTTTEFCA